MKSFKRKPTPKGFTLLEIVIVLGIIAVIIGGSITFLGKFGDGGKLVRVKGDFQTLEAGLRQYAILAGSPPTTAQGLKALIVKPTTPPIPKTHTSIGKEIPVDPWNNEYLYRNPGKKDTTTFEIYSKGPDGQDGTDDDISSQD